MELINTGSWEEAALKFPFVKEYIKVNHSKDIPFTKKQITEAFAEADFLYMRSHIGNWEEENDYYTNLKDNEWSFIANLKNYRDPEHNVAPITLFMNAILKVVIKYFCFLFINTLKLLLLALYIFIYNRIWKILQCNNKDISI